MKNILVSTMVAFLIISALVSVVGAVNTTFYASSYANDDYLNASSVYNGWGSVYDVRFCGDPTVVPPFTTAPENKVWLSTDTTNIKMMFDPGAFVVVNQLDIINYAENYGTQTDRGMRHFTVWGTRSTSASKNLDYANNTGLTQLTTDITELPQHTADAGADNITVHITTPDSYRWYIVKFSDNWGGGLAGLDKILFQHNSIYDVPPPTASFTENATVGIAPTAIQFTDTSTGGTPTSWYWNMGDGFIDRNQSPSHVYTTGGTFTVYLVAGNSAGSTQSTNHYIAIGAAPVASFSSDYAEAGAPLYVSFFDTSTNSPTSWYWVFGDGATATTATPTHVFATPGSYYANLTATNAYGSSTSTYLLITVDAPLTTTPTPTPTPGVPVYSIFVAAPGTGDTSTDFLFQWTFTGAGSYYVDLGGGAGQYYTTNGYAYWHYPVAGTKTITIIGHNDYGNSTLFSHDIVVTAGPVPFYDNSTLTPTTGVAYDTLFNITWGFTNATGYYLNLDDGSPTFFTTNTSYNGIRYMSSGTHSIWIRGTNIYGNSSPHYIDVVVGAPTPTATPTAIPTQAPISAIIRWVNGNGDTITSAHLGDNLTFTYDTVNNGIIPAHENLDWFGISIAHQNPLTGAWMYDDVPFTTAISSYNTSFIPLQWHMDYDGMSWRGSGTIRPGSVDYPVNDTVLRANISAYNITSAHYFYLGYADLTVNHNPFNLGTLGSILRRIGGDAFAYLVALIFVLILACIPLILLRRSIVIVEIMMVALGLGASYLADLIPLWVLFVAGLAMLAIYFLTRNSQPQEVRV